MKKLCFRFDVDTHKCLGEGVPKLLQLASKYDVQFTFFVNAGKAIDSFDYIRKKFHKQKMIEETISFSAYKKLGIKDYLYISIVNPTIAELYPHIINDIVKYKHEIGLHGGRNHQLWHSNAHTWNAEKITDEIVWGKTKLMQINHDMTISGFASPGWNGSDIVNIALKKNGFRYVADRHYDTPVQKIENQNSLIKIPTNILGEPGGVGYLEYCRASGMTDAEIVADFKRKLEERKSLAVMYDHPYYSGVQEIPMLEKLIKMGLAMNYNFVTMNELI